MGSKHPGVFNMAMADGSVRFFRTSGPSADSPETLKALVTRNGRERVTVP